MPQPNSFSPAQHTLMSHVGCTLENCAICAGKVRICTICGGVDTPAGGNGLTTQCHEKQLSQEQKTAIAAGDLDYKNFRWYDKRLGPTIKETLDEKGLTIGVGTIVPSLNRKEGEYICVGVFDNSNEQTMYNFHQVMTLGNRSTAGFIAIIHYAKYQEYFGEL